MIEYIITRLKPPVTTADWLFRFALIGLFLAVLIEKIWEEFRNE